MCCDAQQNSGSVQQCERTLRRAPQKELVAYHNPDTHPLGSFELLASNRIRSDEETLGEIFNGTPYYTATFFFIVRWKICSSTE